MDPDHPAAVYPRRLPDTKPMSLMQNGPCSNRSYPHAPSRGGHPGELWSTREILDGIFYVLRGGIAWRPLSPAICRPRPTVYGWFSGCGGTAVCSRPSTTCWSWPIASGLARKLAQARRSSTAKTIKPTESGGPRGYDAGKKVKGRKRQVLVDTDGQAPPLHAHPTFRIGTLPTLCSASPAASGPSSRRPSPTAPTTPSALPPPPTSRSRSCASTPIRSASSSSPGAGWSSASSPGSIATVGWPRMSKQPSTRPSPSSTPRPSCSSPAASHAPHEFQNRL